jgi:CelD/BcsL family acetyltransferase involved in cellulose biosynthesis
MLGDSRFAVLDAGIAEQRADWLGLWATWPGREVFAHPDYVRLFAGPDERALCAAMKTDRGGILFPFLLRSLAAEPWGPKGEAICDLVSPYGYGGAFAWNYAPAEQDAFWSELGVWARAHDAVSCLVRRSLFPEQQLPFCGEVRAVGSNLVRSLTLSADELWKEYEHKVRKNVNRARQSGLTVQVDLCGSRLAEFLAVYYATMDRHNAEEFYRFPRELFESLVRQLEGQFAFFHVLSGAAVVSTELVLVSVDNIYSFLGGTLPEAYAQRPNDLLKHEVILWGMNAGKKTFVLGGSRSEDDGIIRYKRSFAPNGTRSFEIGTRIFSPEAYDRLIECRRQWEESRGGTWQPRSQFFPLYRA